MFLNEEVRRCPDVARASGLPHTMYEIHIGAFPEHEVEFRLWCLDHELKPIRVIGENPEIMCSYYVFDSDPLEAAKVLIKTAPFPVRDVRIERIVREGDSVHGGGYYEFHFKCGVSNSTEYRDIQRICANLNTASRYVFVGFNTTKKKVKPIVTLRVTEDAFKHRAIVETALKGYVTSVQNEYVCKL